MTATGALSAETTNPTANAHQRPSPCLAAPTAPDADQPDAINNPGHYTWLPNGVEVIQITEHMSFCLGNVVKYVVRADHKGRPLEDLEKAAWYLNREIARRKATTP